MSFMKPLFEKPLGEATRLTLGGKLVEATAAIQRALGLGEPQPSRRSGPPASAAVAVLDGLVREFPQADTPLRREPSGRSSPSTISRGAAASPPATFEEAAYSAASGTLGYKLFVPAGFDDKALPLIVMLHGCTQSPDDFAAGTRMNDIAQERGFLVLYPAQAPRSNSSKCWNWFVPGDQKRGAGEPELLAGLTRHVMSTHRVDPNRVFVAGLSAGGAMADILGREYPELYAAVGVHSGLPQGAAHDIASAFAAMQGGGATSPLRRAAPNGRSSRAGEDPSAGAALDRAAPPTIVFHGDRDATVHPSNGEQVIGAVLGAISAGSDVVASSEKAAAAGRAATRTVHRRSRATPAEPSLAEHWIVHGTGHAWSGGSSSGSYTESAGPDASREMVRFFLEHPLAGARPEPRRWF